MRPLPRHMSCAQMPLIDALDHWRRTTPDRAAITYLTFAGHERRELVLTYADLGCAVDAMASAVEERTRPGDRVALLMDQGVDYIVAFLACLRVGRLAVPLFGVDARRSAHRVRGVLADAGPAATVLDAGADEELVSRVLDLDTIYIRARDARPGAVPVDTPVGLSETAYLQYTSGSTRHPAGVMVTQANLAVAASQLRRPLEIEQSSTIVTWLPYFHDMGLLLGIGASIQAGAHCVHMSPLAFVQQPIRWLQAISDFRASATVVPNFALEHATTRIPEHARRGLDLSGLQSLGNGSEPIRAGSLQAFTDMFAPYGFSHRAHQPGYGLAETTLVVTSALQGEGPILIQADRDMLAQGRITQGPESESTATLVSSGRPIAQDVRVVDPDTHCLLSDGQIGEVWVQGPNVCAGFFRNESMTAEVFRAQSPDLPGEWARTGDLATFVDGELYIVGRTKDLIIVGGKNHYPADIEGTVQESLPHARPNGVAVFAHTRPAADEVAVMVIELDPKQSRGSDRSELSRIARSAVARCHELSLHEVILANPGAIPKTTSGKIQRRACAEKYAQGQFSPETASAR